MAKPELGTKRLCRSCGAKFYDLSKDPIVCPKCGTIFEIFAATARGRAAEAVAKAAGAAAAKSHEAEIALPETAYVELISLEDADAQTMGKTGDVDAVEADDGIEVEETEAAPFIEEQEESDDDVADIIGEGREDEEET